MSDGGDLGVDDGRRHATTVDRSVRWPAWFSLVAVTAATAVLFIGWVVSLGGASHSDLGESLYSTIAIAHGQFGCLFSSVHTTVPVVSSSSPSIAPLYPLLSGAIESILRVGHGTAFPALTHGPAQCAAAYDSAYSWAQRTGAVSWSLRLGYLAWLPLAAGALAVLQTARSPKRGVTAVVLVAVTLEPLVASCLGVVFHPEYLVATGLSLLAVAAARHGRWELTGVLIALGMLSQQFVILVAVVLFFAGSRGARWRFALSTGITWLAVAIPLAVVTSGRALNALIYGSSRVTFDGASAHSKGGTVLWELHLRGVPLFVTSRALPVAAVVVTTVWVKRRFCDHVMDASVLMSLVALAFASRLVFEVNLYGYYFMALSIALLVLDGTRGRVRPWTVAWIFFVVLAFNVIPPAFRYRWEPWSSHGFDALAVASVLLLALWLVVDVVRERKGFGVALTLSFALVVFRDQVFLGSGNFTTLPYWLWQIILVPAAIALASSPLRELAAGRASTESTSSATPQGAP